MRGLLLQRHELSPQVVGPWSFDASLKARARLDGSELTVTSSEAHFGEVRAELSGQVVTAPGRRHVEGRLRVPLSGCQSVLEAMPNGLLPLVGGLRLSGSFGIDLQVRYDSARAARTRAWCWPCRTNAASRRCRPRSRRNRFERPFLREVKGPDGSPMSLESGPGTSSWVSIDDMSQAPGERGSDLRRQPLSRARRLRLSSAGERAQRRFEAGSLRARRQHA